MGFSASTTGKKISVCRLPAEARVRPNRGSIRLAHTLHKLTTLSFLKSIYRLCLGQSSIRAQAFLTAD